MLPSISASPEPADAIVIDGSACHTRANLFAEFARALRFPPHFGHNWDALTDCLRDTGQIAVYIAHAVAVLDDEPPAQLQILIDVLSDAELNVVLGATSAEAPALRASAWYLGQMGSSEH